MRRDVRESMSTRFVRDVAAACFAASAIGIHARCAGTRDRMRAWLRVRNGTRPTLDRVGQHDDAQQAETAEASANQRYGMEWLDADGDGLPRRPGRGLLQWHFARRD